MGKIFMFHNFQNRKKYAQKYGNNKFRKEHFPPLWKLLQNVERWWRVDEQFLFHVSKLKWNPRKSIDASNRRKPFSHKPCLLGCAGWYMVLLFRLSVSLSFFKYLFMTHILFFDINNFLSAAREKKCIINVIYCMGEIFSLWKINRRPKSLFSFPKVRRNTFRRFRIDGIPNERKAISNIFNSEHLINFSAFTQNNKVKYFPSSVVGAVDLVRSRECSLMSLLFRKENAIYFLPSLQSFFHK